MITKTSYPNPPSPKLLEKIGATNLTLADAIAEVVANSFDAQDDETSTRVDISISPKEILVVDNGIGMPEAVLVDAVRLGVNMADYLKRKSGSKGKFGLGMKTACASMGRWWAVYTRPKGENLEYRVVFDLADWERRSDSSDSWTIDIEKHAHDENGPLGNMSHGTAVIVRDLRNTNPMIGAILQKLGESFKPHLLEGDQIFVNKDIATPHEYSFVKGSITKIDLYFGADKQYHITGWVAIDSKTHNEGQYGFNIYRKNQLVQTWNQDWFSSHLMTSRIIGEVHMDFIDATFFKQGLQDSEVWRQACIEMKEFMKPITSASRTLSRKKNILSPKKTSEVIKNMRSALGVEDTPVEQLNDEEVAEPSDSNTDDMHQEILKIIIEAERLVLKKGKHISISIVELEMGPIERPFDYICSDNDNGAIDLQTIVNTDHPLFNHSDEKTHLRNMAVADSILRYLVEKCDYDFGNALKIKFEWLLKAYEGK